MKLVKGFVERMKSIAEVLSDRRWIEFWDNVNRMLDSGDWRFRAVVKKNDGGLFDLVIMGVRFHVNTVNEKVMRAIILANLDKFAVAMLQDVWSVAALEYLRRPEKGYDILYKVARLTRSDRWAEIVYAYSAGVYKFTIERRGSKYVVRDKYTNKEVEVDVVTGDAINKFMDDVFSELLTEVVYHIKDKVKKVYKVIYEKEVKSLLQSI